MLRLNSYLDLEEQDALDECIRSFIDVIKRNISKSKLKVPRNLSYLKNNPGKFNRESFEKIYDFIRTTGVSIQPNIMNGMYSIVEIDNGLIGIENILAHSRKLVNDFSTIFAKKLTLEQRYIQSIWTRVACYQALEFQIRNAYYLVLIHNLDSSLWEKKPIGSISPAELIDINRLKLKNKLEPVACKIAENLFSKDLIEIGTSFGKMEPFKNKKASMSSENIIEIFKWLNDLRKLRNMTVHALDNTYDSNQCTIKTYMKALPPGGFFTNLYETHGSDKKFFESYLAIREFEYYSDMINRMFERILLSNIKASLFKYRKLLMAQL